MLSAQLELFTQRLPHRPYHSDDLAYGLKIAGAEKASKFKYIQHNSPAFVSWLVFDIDRKNSADDWYTRDLPPPAWVASTPKTGRCHVAYGLVHPVVKTDAGRTSPLRYAAAIEEAYRVRLDADAGYAGLITKNPLNHSWRIWLPPSSNDGLYSLDDLAEYVELPKTKAKRTAEERGLGRNVSLFDTLRVWAYVEIRRYWKPGGADKWDAMVALEAVKLNDSLFGQNRLSVAELRGIAKSVSRWTWKNLSPGSLQDLIDRTHTPAMQSERGKKGGRPSLGAPWEDEGVSRRTWFRRRSGEA